MTDIPFQIINSVVLALSLGIIIWVMKSTLKCVKDNAASHLKTEMQLNTAIHKMDTESLHRIASNGKITEMLSDIQQTLKVIESKVSDLNVRVNIAEVRLEERKPQQFMIPQQVQQIPVIPKKPGRKPKAQA